jgi:hypothetical protein
MFSFFDISAQLIFGKVSRASIGQRDRAGTLLVEPQCLSAKDSETERAHCSCCRSPFEQRLKSQFFDKMQFKKGKNVGLGMWLQLSIQDSGSGS